MKFTNKNIIILSCVTLFAALYFFSKKKNAALQMLQDTQDKITIAKNSKTTVAAEQKKLENAANFVRIPYTAAVKDLKSGDVLMSSKKFELTFYKRNTKNSEIKDTIEYLPDEQFVIVDETGAWFKRNTSKWFAKEDLYNKAYIKRIKE